MPRIDGTFLPPAGVPPVEVLPLISLTTAVTLVLS